MTSAWVVLIITALTDFVITFAAALGSAMTTSQIVGWPEPRTVLVAVLGGAVVAARTIQQALKAEPANTAALRGDAPPIVIPATTAHRLADAGIAIMPKTLESGKKDDSNA